MNVLWRFQSIPHGNIKESVLLSVLRGFVTVIHIKSNENYWHKYLVHQEASRLLFHSIFIILSAQAAPLPKLLLPLFLVLISSYENILGNVGVSTFFSEEDYSRKIPLLDWLWCVLCFALETDPISHSKDLDVILKFYWDLYWMGRESELFLLSGLSSRLFIVRVGDERQERRKKAVKWGLQEKRRGSEKGQDGSVLW